MLRIPSCLVTPYSSGSISYSPLARATALSWHCPEKLALACPNGLIFAVRSEQAIREELVALVIVIPFAWLIGASTMRLSWSWSSNSSIPRFEKLADRLTTDHDPQIGRVKDMGSASVGVALLMAGVFWLFAIAERIGAI
jgi:diacylglycerol kinase (ATP)